MRSRAGSLDPAEGSLDHARRGLKTPPYIDGRYTGGRLIKTARE